MRLTDAPVIDVRGPLTSQRGRLLNLLDSLRPEQWAAATAAPQWSVKDIALHLIDVDLSWLAWHRDHDQAGNLGEAAWRLLTGARYDPSQVQLIGDPALAEPLLQVRGIIVQAGAPSCFT